MFLMDDFWIQVSVFFSGWLFRIMFLHPSLNQLKTFIFVFFDLACCARDGGGYKTHVRKKIIS